MFDKQSPTLGAFRILFTFFFVENIQMWLIDQSIGGMKLVIGQTNYIVHKLPAFWTLRYALTRYSTQGALAFGSSSFLGDILGDVLIPHFELTWLLPFLYYSHINLLMKIITCLRFSRVAFSLMQSLE